MDKNLMITEYNSKQRISSSMLKYSNVNLFNNIKKTKKYNLYRSRNKNNDINRFNNYCGQTATSINFCVLKNIFSSLNIDNKEDCFDRLLTERQSKKKEAFPKKNLANEINFRRHYNKLKTSSNLCKKSRRLFIDVDENKYTDSYNNNTKYEDIKILLRLQKESNYTSIKTSSNSKSCRTLIDCKDRYLIKHNKCSRNYLDQILTYKFENYNSNNKREIKQKLDENHESKIEAIDDKMQSLNKMETLFNNKFINKANDYLKFILNFKENEKNKLLILQNIVLKHRNEITDLNKKIQKIENEKYSIFKWINLQIQLLERTNNTYEEKQKNKANNEIKEQQINNNRDRDKSLTRRSFWKKSIKLKYKNEEKNKSDKNSPSEKIEVKKINKYKNKLIFETPSDAYDKLEEYEYKIIKYMSQNNQIISQILNYKKKLNEMLSEKNKLNKHISYQITQCELILQNLKSKNDSLIKYIFLLKNNNINTEKHSKNKFNKTNILSKTEMHFVQKCDLDLVYKKIRILFNNCKSVAPEKMIISYNDKNNCKENEIINILEFLELFVIFLMNKIDEYKKSEKFIRSLKEMQVAIEKKRRIVNNIRKITKEREKADYIKKNIENKNNKILFIPLRKVGINEVGINNKKGNKWNSTNKNIQNKIDLFEEYLLYNN